LFPSHLKIFFIFNYQNSEGDEKDEDVALEETKWDGFTLRLYFLVKLGIWWSIYDAYWF